MFGLLRDLNEWKGGALTAMIARAADFYGPETPNGLPNVLVFEPFAKHQKASWLASDSVPHSYTYTPDAARSLVTLGESECAWNQTWHVATTPNPPTGKEFIAIAAKEFGVTPRYRALSRPVVRVIGWFNLSARYALCRGNSRHRCFLPESYRIGEVEKACLFPSPFLSAYPTAIPRPKTNWSNSFLF
jgi:nucleoside-diphosphate-sugar epimerase